MRIILYDDEVSSNEDEPLQKQLRQLFDAGPAIRDVAVAADKEAVQKRAAEEATVKRATEEAVVKKAVEQRATEEAAVNAVAAEAAGAAGASMTPSQAPPAAEAKRATTLSGSTSSAKCSYRGVWKPRFVQLSPLFFFLTTFLSRSASSSVAATTGAAAADAGVGAGSGAGS
jgi:hypothetical protein